MPKKRIMRKFKMTEISSVDKPAQGGALSVLMKRNDGHNSVIEKRFYMTEANEGHSHLLNLNDNSRNNMGGETSYTNSHDHPYIIGDNGVITIGEAHGHTHSITMTVSEILKNGYTEEESMKKMFDSSVYKKGAANSSGSKHEETIMPENKDAVEKAAKDLKIVKAQLATATALATLSDIQKAHYNGLDDNGKESYLAKSDVERTADVDIAKSSDPVIYKSLDGTQFNKSDDPRMVAMAKQADANANALEKANKQNADMAIAKRVEKELTNLPGDLVAKSALLNAVESISDAEVKKSVTAILTSCNSSIAKAFEEIGSQENDINKKAEDELDSLAKAYAEKHDVNISKAFEKVLETPKGQQLYANSNS